MLPESCKTGYHIDLDKTLHSHFLLSSLLSEVVNYIQVLCMTHGISFSREGGGVGEVARKSGSCHEVMVVHENFLIHKS